METRVLMLALPVMVSHIVLDRGRPSSFPLSTLQLITDQQGKGLLGVTVTPSMVGGLHVTETGLIQSKIDTVPKEKALYAAAKDQGQSSIKMALSQR